MNARVESIGGKSEGICKASANLKGEHIGCDNGPDHAGWPHSNREHELIWQSDAEARAEPG